MKYYILIDRSPSKGESGERCGSQYDLGRSCKRCGTGAELIGKLYTSKLKGVKERLFHTMDGDLLISSEVYSSLKELDIALRETSPVVDYSGNPLPFHHLHPTLSFPKLLPQSQGLKIEGQCPICKQNGYSNEVIIGDLEKGIRTRVMPLTFHYEGVDRNVLNRSDIFRTWEHMGSSNLIMDGNRVLRYARPLLIISGKLKQALESLKIKKLSFSEIIFHIHSPELQ